MTRDRPGSLIDHVTGICWSVFLAALALFVAVRLIESVWVVMVIMAVIAVLASSAVAIYRTRFRGW